MKRLAFLCALCLLAASAARAQGPGVGFGAHANFTFGDIPGPQMAGASKQLTDAYGPGLGGGVHLDVDLALISFRVSGDYIHYGIDEDAFQNYYKEIFGSAATQLTIEGGGLNIWSLTASGKMGILPLPLITPYLTAGGGLAWLSSEEAKTSVSGVPGRTFPAVSTSGKWTAHLGVGVDIKIGIKLFGEVKYAWIFTEGENSTFVPVTVGVTF